MVPLNNTQTMFIERYCKDSILTALKNSPVVSILGPRQCGKSTLAKMILENIPNYSYLDLERPSDLRKLDDAEWFLSTQKEKLICIDEIQRIPDLFPLIRSLVDEWGKTGSFLILGSASRELINQSSESLAGRISHKILTPFIWQEIKDRYSLNTYFHKGGFPRSILNKNDMLSYEWREDFITTFLERDLIQWHNFTPLTMRRLWQMLAHINGQTIDYTNLSNSLDITSPTVKSYIDLLASTFMVYIVPPYFSNLGKRLIKSPKIYLSDSGITSTLLGLRSFEDIMGHPGYGAMWEQIVLSNLKGLFPKAEFFFYRTSNGAEIDFIMKHNNQTIAIECKASQSPKLTKGNFNALEDISPDRSFVIAPITESWSLRNNINVIGLDDLIKILK